MGEVNLDRLRELAGQVRNAVRELQEIALLGRESFLRDRRLVNSAKYLLIVAAAASLDILTIWRPERAGEAPGQHWLVPQGRALSRVFLAFTAFRLVGPA